MEKELASIVGESNVVLGEVIGSSLTDSATANYFIDGHKPQAVVFPSTPEELSALIKLASEWNLTVVPAGSGTRLSLGNPPEQVALVVSTTRMNRILEYEPSDLTASVEAGCTLQEFNRRAGGARQWLPCDPPNADEATLGGIAAMDDFGPLRHAYGLPRDYVIGIEVVQADGTAIKAGGRVVKNVTGYDLNKLFVGSFGTLGVITKLNFKLRPRPEAEATAALLSTDRGKLFQTAQSVMASELLPSAMLLVNNRVSQKIDLRASHSVLLVRLNETAPAINYQLDQLKQMAYHEGLELVEMAEGESRALWSLIADFHKHCGAYLSLRASVLPSSVEEIFKRLEMQLGEMLTEVFVLAQVGTGVVKVEGAVLSHESAALSRAASALTRVRDDCRRIGGSLIIERAPIEIKRQMDVWGDVGPTVDLMRAIKRQFDPKRILNPGRFVAGL